MEQLGLETSSHDGYLLSWTVAASLTIRLNDLAILCCELTSPCVTLAEEWLGALYSLCCYDTGYAHGKLVTEVGIADALVDILILNYYNLYIIYGTTLRSI